jgi:ABC-2 type transport system ATP-binding protein
MSMFDARGLKKRYGSLQAVDGVSFSARQGETLGLLGPNGAGKTTTVAMIAGLLQPDTGEVLIDGRRMVGDTDPVKGRIGLVPQELALFEQLSARANLETFGALYGLRGTDLRRAVDANLALVGLSDRAKDLVSTYSGGMKRRLNLAAALLHDPQLLILDEPTVGVDPQSRNAIFDNLESLKKRGLTLIYTTHYMEEAERLCDRIVIMDHGRVLKDNTLAELYRELPVANVLNLDLAGDPTPHLAALQEVPDVVSVEVRPGTLSIGLRHLASGTAAVLALLDQAGVDVNHLGSERATLETVFLNLTGRSLRDA